VEDGVVLELRRELATQEHRSQQLEAQLAVLTAKCAQT
jgi:BMFP domain-containing protein YqiC